MRIWGSQWGHFPLHRSVFCFRFSVKLSDLLSSSIASLFPSFRIHGIVVIDRLDSVHSGNPLAFAYLNLVSVGECHEHRRIA
jgi:hypothetical protein